MSAGEVIFGILSVAAVAAGWFFAGYWVGRGVELERVNKERDR